MESSAGDGSDGTAAPSPGDHEENLGQAAGRRERRWILWSSPALAVLIAAGVVIGALTAGSGNPNTRELDPGEWTLVIGLTLAALVVTIATTAGFVLWRRRRGSALFARSPLWELPTQKQRRALVRDMRRGRPIDPQHRELALRVARDITRRRGLIWLYLAIAAINAVNLVIAQDESRWLYLAGTLIFLGAAGWFAWLITRMQRAARDLEHLSSDA